MTEKNPRETAGGRKRPLLVLFVLAAIAVAVLVVYAAVLARNPCDRAGEVVPGDELFSIAQDGVLEFSYSDAHVFLQAHRWKTDAVFNLSVERSDGRFERCAAGVGLLKVLERLSLLKAAAVLPLEEAKGFDARRGHLRFYDGSAIEPAEFEIMTSDNPEDALKLTYFGHIVALDIDQTPIRRLRQGCAELGVAGKE